MTNQNDPISEIKKTEESSKKKLEESKRNFEEKLIKFEETLSEKRDEFEQNLKDHGNQKLETVKKEAGELFKSKMATAEKKRNQCAREAKEKQAKSVEVIIESFTEYIKAN